MFILDYKNKYQVSTSLGLFHQKHKNEAKLLCLMKAKDLCAGECVYLLLFLWKVPDLTIIYHCIIVLRVWRHIKVI